MQTLLINREENKSTLYNGPYMNSSCIIVKFDNVSYVTERDKTHIVYDVDNNSILVLPINKTIIVYSK